MNSLGRRAGARAPRRETPAKEDREERGFGDAQGLRMSARSSHDMESFGRGGEASARLWIA